MSNGLADVDPRSLSSTPRLVPAILRRRGGRRTSPRLPLSLLSSLQGCHAKLSLLIHSKEVTPGSQISTRLDSRSQTLSESGVFSNNENIKSPRGLCPSRLLTQRPLTPSIRDIRPPFSLCPLPPPLPLYHVLNTSLLRHLPFIMFRR